jgi:hypothetical protein
LNIGEEGRGFGEGIAFELEKVGLDLQAVGIRGFRSAFFSPS